MAISTAKAAFIIMIGTVLSKVLGFLRDIILAASYGTSSISDAYITALIIPTIIFGSIGIALGTAFIPIYGDIRREQGRSMALHFTNVTMNNIIVVCGIISLIGIIFAEEIVGFFAIGFQGETLRLSVEMTKIMFPGIIFVCLNYVFMSYLQLKDNFKIPALMGIPFNGVIIIGIILSADGNVLLLAYGTILAFVVQFVFQLFYSFRIDFRYQPKFGLSDQNFKKLGLQLFPVFLGVSVLQLNTLVDRVFASVLPEGSIAALNYATRLEEFVFGVFTMSIAAAIFPHFSRTASQGDLKKLKEHLNTAINVMIIITIPITVIIMVLSEPIVAVLFERGSFDLVATKMTAGALFFYSAGIIGFGIRDVLIRTFYALLDSKTPMINSIIIIVINVILNFFFVTNMDHRGLALATSIAIVVGTLILMYQLELKLKYINKKQLFLLIGKIGLASGIMGLITKWAFNQLSSLLEQGFIYEFISIAVAILVGAFVYLVLVILLRVKESELLFNLLKRKG